MRSAYLYASESTTDAKYENLDQCFVTDSLLFHQIEPSNTFTFCANAILNDKSYMFYVSIEQVVTLA